MTRTTSGPGSGKALLQALEALGRGFLRHPDNERLRQALSSGELDARSYTRQLARLVLRLLFLLAAEERGALPEPGAPGEARGRYLRHYSVLKLRERASAPLGGALSESWRDLRTVMDRLDRGYPALALPALGGSLWSSNRNPGRPELGCPWLVDADCPDGALLKALRLLSPSRNGGEPLHPEPDALCSFAALLRASRPRVEVQLGRFELGAPPPTGGGPSSPPAPALDALLDSALEPLLGELAQAPVPGEGLLGLRVLVSPLGSGQLLLGAARRLAGKLAELEGSATGPRRGPLGRGIASCLYGVDRDPLVVEACRLALWLESGRGLELLPILEGRLLSGDALLGATPELMEAGIPDAAFEASSPGERAWARHLRRQNRLERSGQTSLFAAVAWSGEPEPPAGGETRSEPQLSRYRAFPGDSGRFPADAWCAAFLLSREDPGAPTITEDLWRRIQREPRAAPPALRRAVCALAREHRFFHWHLAFPEVLGEPATGTGRGAGFDAVLGVPPQGSPEPRSALAIFARRSGRYPLTGRGELRLAGLFAELYRSLVAPRGRVACLVPPGFGTGGWGREFFRELVHGRNLLELSAHPKPGSPGETGAGLLLAFGGRERRAERFSCAFPGEPGARRREGARFELSAEELRSLNPNTKTCPPLRSRLDALLLLWFHRRLPVLARETGRGARGAGPWGLLAFPLFRPDEPRSVFRVYEDLLDRGWTPRGNAFERDGRRALPVYEARMVELYDHRAASLLRARGWAPRRARLERAGRAEHADPDFAVIPRYWVPEEEVARRLAGRWERGWLLAWRAAASPSRQRVLLPVLLPRAGVAPSLPLALPAGAPERGGLLAANLSSLVLEYAARQKLWGQRLEPSFLRQLPVLPPAAYAEPCPWNPDRALGSWLLPRLLELAYTSRELADFARDHGYEGPPFRWDDERRFHLRCELDAAFLRLYLGSSREWRAAAPPELLRAFPHPREAARHLLDALGPLRRREERAFGRYRSREAILGTLDRLLAAEDEGSAYESPLRPRAGTPAIAVTPDGEERSPQ